MKAEWFLPVIEQFGSYYCSQCGEPLYFERIKAMDVAQQDAIGACVSFNCHLKDVRVRIRLNRIMCEMVPREMQGADL